MGRTDARMSLTLPSELKDKFVELAEKNQRSLTQELVLAIQEHIERMNQPEKQTFRDMAELEDYIKSVIKKELSSDKSD